MATQPESAVYDAGVFQLETTTPVQGGVGGASNAPLLNLANRTAYLKAHVDAVETAASGNAPINSPNFSGTPTAPDVASGDSTGKIANTKFVQNAVGGLTSIDCSGSANVNLTAAQAGCAIIILTGALTANINVIVPSAADRWIFVNSTTGAFQPTVKTAAGTGFALSQNKAFELYCDATNVACIEGASTATSLNRTGDSMSGDLGMTNHDIYNIKTSSLNAQVAIATTSGAINIDWSAGPAYKQAEPTGAITYTFTAPRGPCRLQLTVDSDGTSTAQVITWPAAVKWIGSTWSGTNNKIGVITLWYDGAGNYLAMGLNQV